MLRCQISISHGRFCGLRIIFAMAAEHLNPADSLREMKCCADGALLPRGPAQLRTQPGADPPSAGLAGPCCQPTRRPQRPRSPRGGGRLALRDPHGGPWRGGAVRPRRWPGPLRARSILPARTLLPLDGLWRPVLPPLPSWLLRLSPTGWVCNDGYVQVQSALAAGRDAAFAIFAVLRWILCNSTP